MKQEVAAKRQVILVEYVRFNRAGLIFVHPFAVTLPAAKTCFSLPRRSVFHAERKSGFLMDDEETHGTVYKEFAPFYKLSGQTSPSFVYNDGALRAEI